jgi:mono/diheme cytochrome c family protein
MYDSSKKLRILLFIIKHSAFIILLTGCQQNPYRDGEQVYKAHCANCHLDNGQGLGALIPPLTDAEYLRAHRDALPCIVRHGLKDTIVVAGKTYAEAMPGVPTLSEIDIANVLNYVHHQWGAEARPFSPEEVRRQLERCE